ncbi:MAG TPA: HEAT repeat domain-containing protein [Gemmataceae bacterium]|nr:HEAT repeat domain-containing protein [Gemmataceae bacterium]
MAGSTVVECPRCRFRSVVVVVGRPVQCPGCRETWTPTRPLTVPGAPAAAPPPAPAAAAPIPVDIGDWGAPAAPAPAPLPLPPPAPVVRPIAQPPSASHPRPAPRPTPAPLPVEDDEPPPRPAYSPRRRVAGGVNGVLMVVGLVLLLIAGAGVAVGVVVLTRDKPDDKAQTTPEENPPPKTPPKVEPKIEPKIEPNHPTTNVPTLPPEPAGMAPLQSHDLIHQRLLKCTVLVFAQDGYGSGVAIHAGKKLVLTTDHVAENQRAVSVMFPEFTGGEVISALDYYSRRASTAGITGRVVARDPARNLALLELEQWPTGARPVWFAREPAAADSAVYWVGGSDEPRATVWQKAVGSVQAREKRQQRYSRGMFDATVLETQPAAGKGDSGGALVNDRGELVAVVSTFLKNNQPVSGNIDLAEVRTFLRDYFEQIGEKWTDPVAPGSPGSDAPNLNALIAVLRGGAPADRPVAARRIGNLGPQAKAAVPALLTTLESADADLEAEIGAALTRIGPPEAGAESVLVPALRSKSAVARGYALRTLAAGAMIPDDAIPALVAALNDPSAEVRIGAAVALASLGEKARAEALGPLLDRAADADPAVRKAAAAALAKIGPVGPDDKPVLTRKLADPDARVRGAAAVAFAPLITSGEQAAEVWLPLLKDPTPELKVAAIRGLLSYPDHLPKVAGQVLPLLEDSDKSVQAAAIEAAGKMKGVPGVPGRVATAYRLSTDPQVKAAAAEAVVSLAEPTTSDIMALKTILVDGPPKARRAAADKLAVLKEGAAEVIPDLIERVKKDDDPEVKAAAMRALAAVGRDGRQAVPLAADLFNAKDTPDVVRLAAIDLLGVGGPDGVKALKAAINQPLPDVIKARMCLAFAAAGADARDVHPWMIDLAETLVACREPVTAALVKSGDDAAVQRLLKRTDVYRPAKVGEAPETYPQSYRKWAIETLGKIDLEKVMTRDTKEKLILRMKSLERDTDPELAKAATVVLKKLTP